MRLGLGLIALLIGCGGGKSDGNTGKDSCADTPSEDCAEICDDGVDNNLDELLDCADPACAGQCGEDCDDGIDNDLDTKIDCSDEDCKETCDKDGDGWLDIFDGGGDCNDFNPDVNPGATEVCDGYDNDCNGLVDKFDPDLDETTLLKIGFDEDGDGFGDAKRAIQDCSVPSGMVGNIDDCDDRNPLLNPNMPEICNDIDDNCDGLTDDADPLVVATGGTTFYADLDADGYGDPATPVLFCRAPLDHVDNDLDCDDTDPLILGPSEWVPDLDGDGFGDGTPTGPIDCVAPGPGLVSALLPIDCDESDPNVYPTAVETCGDGIDSDCDTRDCPNWSDDFETGTVGSDWTLSGNANWFAQGGTVFNGAFAAETGNIADNQISAMEVVADYSIAGDVSFFHTGDTEGSWDYLRFYIDGIQQQSWSGSWAWQQSTYAVTAGIHTLRWEYDKDGSVSIGADTVWVDDIELLNGDVP